MLTAPLAAKARPTRECDRDDLSAAGSRREGPGEQVPNDDDATSTFPALLSHARRGLGVGATVGRHAPPLPRMTQTAIYITLTCVPLKFSARPVPISTRGRRHLHWSGLLARSELGPRSKKKRKRKEKKRKLGTPPACSKMCRAAIGAKPAAQPLFLRRRPMRTTRRGNHDAPAGCVVRFRSHSSDFGGCAAVFEIHDTQAVTITSCPCYRASLRGPRG